jgi:hypothetical protein
MTLDEKFVPVRTAIYEIVSNFFKTIAGFAGYPENPGMSTFDEISSDVYARVRYIESLPRHTTYWPPMQAPESWFETIFGPTPKIEPIPRYIYESKEEGFYNFYIENYKNIFFLPDWISEFLQVRLHICLDISVLEAAREVLFVGFVVYSQMVVLRIAVSWLIYINPYTIPWCYLAASIDWTEEAFQGLLPSILGVNVTGAVFLGMLGAVGDSLNHLVFTMPFLPSEGEEGRLLIDQQMRDVLIFHYLPITWYRYPIPNNIREFWYYERPDILEYIYKSYKNLDIQLLPDSIIQELNQKGDLLTQTNSISDYISTEILSNENLHNIFFDS